MAHLLAQNKEMTKLEVYSAPTYKAEAEYIVHQLKKRLAGQVTFQLIQAELMTKNSWKGRLRTLRFCIVWAHKAMLFSKLSSVRNSIPVRIGKATFGISGSQRHSGLSVDCVQR